jgi:membrane protein CcdC involved in cytochrome C biogenesis
VVTGLLANTIPFWVPPALVVLTGVALLLVPRRRYVGHALLIATGVAVLFSLLAIAGSSRFPGSW